MPAIDLDRTAHQHAAALRDGDYSARALTEATLALVRAQEPAINAYITLMEDEALAQADAADARIAAAEAGPLTGIPIAISSGGQSTTLLVRRTPSSSSTSTTRWGTRSASAGWIG